MKVSSASVATGVLLFHTASCPPLLAAGVFLDTPTKQTTQYLLNFSFSNPGEGVYNTASFDILKDLFDAGVGPTVSIQADADFFTGWNMAYDESGVAHLTNNGIVPEGTFTVWDTETMVISSTVQTAALEQNGVAGFQGGFTLGDVTLGSWDPSAYDSIIVKSDDPLFTAPNYNGPVTPGELGTFTAVSQDEFSSYTGQAPKFVVADPNDFTAPTSFAVRHPGLNPEDDNNHNGRSNFLDDAAGEDPTNPQARKALQITGDQVVLRERVNAVGVTPVVKFSTNLDTWDLLEEGTHYTLVSDVMEGFVRVRTVQLLIDGSSLFLRVEYP